MSNKNTALTIREVANGFIIVIGGVVRNLEEYKNDKNIYIYYSLEDLCEGVQELTKERWKREDAGRRAKVEIEKEELMQTGDSLIPPVIVIGKIPPGGTIKDLILEKEPEVSLDGQI